MRRRRSCSNVGMARAHALVRLFVAVDPPGEVCERLAAWARVAVRGLGLRRGTSAPVRVLDPGLLHVTLCFLGERPVEEIDAIAGALEECAAPVGELSIGAPLWLPARRPHALAVEVHDQPGVALGESLGALHGRLSGALGRACGYREERRRFRAHVTLARLRADRRREGGGVERVLPATPPLSFTPGAIVLYRSWLSPGGASYEPLVARTLAPS
jgi:RNA 2',3'-cyclic 3'-phosphodiesterase